MTKIHYHFGNLIFIYILVFSIHSLNCNSETNKGASNQLNGEFCTKIDYFNSVSGTANTLNLKVKIIDGFLTKIYWPQSAWLENLFLPETKIK